MDNLYTVVLIILMALAVLDLIVGVSNDAVNFLNSAIGSKVAPRFVILTVASVGIIVGSLFSNGMMEIARSGVFHPGMYTFSDIMFLFLAVMFTDVILLDMFNTFGLPTSTTVSLIFELLGSAIAVAVAKIWQSDILTAADLGQYINSGKAMGIISGILTSVVVAFVCGTVIMYITRIIFSFRYNRTFKSLGAAWCGIALTAISYFAIFKGLKGSTLIDKQTMQYMNDNIFMLVCYTWAFWTAIMFLLQHVFKMQILKFTVLAGTMSLALAFAGNDLVNFIGVFMAGFDSYNIASATGDMSMLMTDLTKPVVANTTILAIAGIIMAGTLWFSKKARSVTETEINLARQDVGVERFGSTSLSRSMVRSAININKNLERYTPNRLKVFVNSRFRPIEIEGNKAPFDLIRATVNLTVASLLISLATSLKLPLSTTYVTFMVAMGSSLADKAWGRESAVYRITGVLTVVAGWFLTAFIAFTVAFIIASILMIGGAWSVGAIGVVCILILVQSTVMHKRRSKKHEASEKIGEELTSENIVDTCVREVCETMIKVTRIYDQTLTGLFNEDRRLLKNMVKESEDLYQYTHEKKHQVFPVLQKLQENIDTAHYYINVVDYMDEISKALVHITRPSFVHIDNNHEGLTKEQIQDLKSVNRHVSEIYDRVNYMLKSNDFSNLDETLEMRDKLFEIFADVIKNQLKRSKISSVSTKGSVLYLSIITETKTMILQSRNLLKSQKYFVLK